MCSAEVTEQDISDLLALFEKKPFVATSFEEGSLEDTITKKCEQLLKKDYTLLELDNTNGFLSSCYPARIFIPESERSFMTSTIIPNNETYLHMVPTPLRESSLINKNFHQQTTSSSSTMPSCSSSTTATANSNMESTMQPNQPQQPQNTNSQYQQNHMQPTATVNAAAASSTIYEDQYDINKMRELVTMAKYARCRQRFVVPVIMYHGKYVCRSATISIHAETYGRKAADYMYDCLNSANFSGSQTVDDENNDNSLDLMVETSPFTYDEVIKSDAQLLKILNVSTIVDLMVEKRKIKYFVAVSSSEKSDHKHHYEKFNILSLPYPGCEFFKDFRDNNYVAKNLHYDWTRSFNDADITIPPMGCITELNINWSEYKSWDLVLLTQNYLKLCLKYIKEEKSGLLVHCISGWDRTPLFISLIRISLWADGLIHRGLSPKQITYLTLAYDWFLFGHRLPDRLRKGEDILFFCFHMIKFITDDEFGIVEHHRKRTKTSSSSGGSSNLLNRIDGNEDEATRDYDQDSNDSFSNSSLYDMSSLDSTCTVAACGPLTNRSPNPKRTRTSPITVPGATRQRHESSSSVGSWLHVTDTGSVDSTKSGALNNSGAKDKDAANNSGNPRFCRLRSVRATFIHCYGKSVGLKFKEGSGMNIVSYISNFTEQIF